jgi:hypothetical protein
MQSPKRCGIFCLPHTRRWIKSKTSPIAPYIEMVVAYFKVKVYDVLKW